MNTPAMLEYATQPPPNRYEWEMESERARWLRRRFMWFTGTLAVLALITVPMSLAHLANGSGYLITNGVLGLLSALISMGVVGWAWWYAYRRVRNERRLFTIAFWLVVGLGLYGIFGARISGELAVLAELNRYDENVPLNDWSKRPKEPIVIRIDPDGFPVSVREDLPPGIGNTRPAAPGQRASPALVRTIQQTMSLGVVTWSVLSSHLLACLFLPWTVREATRPALLLLGGAAVIILADILLGRASLWYLGGAVLFLPLTVLPGIGWCWWRYSRFQRRFRSVFESKQLRQLTYELTGARRIHEASLPPVLNVGPLRLSYIYEPMSQIGGDLLFVHPRPPENPPDFTNSPDLPPPPRQTLVLLDVTGHGIAAALTVNRLIGELERIFAETPNVSAGGLISALNRYVFLTLATHGVFVTGVAITVDATEHPDVGAAYRGMHKVSFASAGHPATFFRRADGTVERLESTSTMLGVLPPEQYSPEEHNFRLRPGEAIVAYTDGALEARNLEDDMMGIEGVRELVREISHNGADPFNWPEQIIRRVASWRSSPPADDTLIACVYRPAVPADIPHRVREQRQEQRIPEPALAAAS